MSEHCLKSVACAFCSCHCTDIDIVIQDGKVTRIYPPCPVAEKGFRVETDDPPSHGSGGAYASNATCIEEIYRRLRAARLPLIWIGSGISYENQRSAVKLAKTLCACVDTPASKNAFGITRAYAESGMHWLSLGGLQEKVDTLVFWGCDLARKYPRFWERFVKNGRVQRLVNVNSLLPAADNEVVLNLPINPQLCLEILTQLRLMNKNQAVAASPLLHALFTAIHASRYGCFIFDPTQKACHPVTLRQAFQLIQEMNDTREERWFGLLLERGVNATGASTALLLETGYPGAVRFVENSARFSSLEWSAEYLIDNEETDLVVQVGQVDSQIQDKLIGKIEQNPQKMGYIVLDSNPPVSAQAAWLPVKPFGLNSGGTALRMDGLPIPIRPVFDSPGWELTEALERLAGEVSL